MSSEIIKIYEFATKGIESSLRAGIMGIIWNSNSEKRQKRK